MKKTISSEKKKEFDRFIELARAGKLSHWSKDVLRQWCEVRIGVKYSERQLRRIVNQTKN